MKEIEKMINNALAFIKLELGKVSGSIKEVYEKDSKERTKQFKELTDAVKKREDSLVPLVGSISKLQETIEAFKGIKLEGLEDLSKIDKNIVENLSGLLTKLGEQTGKIVSFYEKEKEGKSNDKEREAEIKILNEILSAVLNSKVELPAEQDLSELNSLLEKTTSLIKSENRESNLKIKEVLKEIKKGFEWLPKDRVLKIDEKQFKELTKSLSVTVVGGKNTQYAEGEKDSEIVGTAILWEDASNTLRAVSVAKPLPISATSLPLPAGAATSSKQDTMIAQLAYLVAFEIPAFNYIGFTYVAAGNGTGEVETLTYKTGGAGGTTVATLTLAYNSDDEISSVTKS